MEELRQILTCSPTAQPASPELRARDAHLRLGHNVCYIVAGIVVEGDRVLMMQEAKASCWGRWYFPAGRMEKNETIQEAVKREVKEETGVEFEPEALIAVELGSHKWVRFTLTGHVAGGSLKTPAEADKESLQAKWLPADVGKLRQEVKLRANDCLPLIELATNWFKTKPYFGLPVAVPHCSSSLRLVPIARSGERLQVLTLQAPTGSTSFPCSVFGDERLFQASITQTLKSCGYSGAFNVHGVLSVEHTGQPHGTYDGICLSLLLVVTSNKLEPEACSEWVDLEEECAKRIKNTLDSKLGCAALLNLDFY